MRRLWSRHRWIFAQLARREIAQRYRGSLFGLAWSLINPLLMLGMYSFVFTVVLQARWPGMAARDDSAAYVVMLFSGLAVHAFLADCLARAPQQIVGNANFVRKVVFPLPVIAVAQLGAAAFHFAINLLLLLALHLVVFGLPPLTIVLLPLVVLPLAAFGLGIMWGVSALTVYFRDLGQVVGVLTTLLLFLSPALYPIEQVPDSLRTFLYLNPLTPAVEQLRMVAIRGEVPGFLEWAGFLAAGLAVLALGWTAFRSLQAGFADVL